MINKIATILLCSSAPVALFAQSVDLRSADEFISVEGEIVGFNGVMLRVQTNVGQISVPASEVICYGAGCLQIVANNDFGLTQDAFQDVVSVSAQEAQARSDDLSVAFAAAPYGTLYNTLAGAFTVASSVTSVELGANGKVTLQNDRGNETATLTVVSDASAADIVIENVGLGGTGEVAFSGPAGWASGKDLPFQMVGMQAYSVMVAPNANIQSITLNDLARIYAGEVTNWSQVGGADVNILPLQLPPNSSVGEEINALVMEPSGKEVAANVLTMADQGGIIASINQFPGSVSVVSAGRANPDLTVSVAGSCGIAVAPTPFNITSGDYPLVGAVFASYNKTPETALVAELFDFATTDIAQGLIAAEGFVNHGVNLQPANKKNDRLSGLLGASLDDAQRVAAAQKFQILFDADRMSPTLIGGPVSGVEAAWNRAMMLDLTKAIEDPANAGREIFFVGQGQSTSGSQAAIDASAAAAAEVLAAVSENAGAAITAGNLTLSSYGFGNVSPATCIDGQVAGTDYTRVEIWIR